ncbi:MAG: DUF3341 domain-containing protein [Polyangiaceae bacterium]
MTTVQVPTTEGLPADGPPAEGPAYGLLAELATPEALIHAARRVREEGYREVDAYTPYPIEEVSEALAVRASPLPFIVFGGGVVGGATAFALQRWFFVVSYPLNVAGKPLLSWPMFIPITFELTILFAGIAAVLGMFVLCRLPMPYHPVFNAPRFALVSRDRYFLAVRAIDPKFDVQETGDLLRSLTPFEVTLVRA